MPIYLDQPIYASPLSQDWLRYELTGHRAAILIVSLTNGYGAKRVWVRDLFGYERRIEYTLGDQRDTLLLFGNAIEVAQVAGYSAPTVAIIGYFHEEEIEINPGMYDLETYLVGDGTGFADKNNPGSHGLWAYDHISQLPPIKQYGLNWRDAYGFISQPALITVPASLHYRVFYDLASNTSDTDNFRINGYDRQSGELFAKVNNGSIAKAVRVLGLIRTPIEWYSKPLRYYGLRHSQPVITKTLAKSAGVALVSSPNTSGFDYPDIYGDASISGSTTGSRTVKNTEMVRLGRTKEITVDATDALPQTYDYPAYQNAQSLRIVGHITEIDILDIPVYDHRHEIEIKPPELIYPPASTAGLSFAYRSEKPTGRYPNIENLKFYLSGGAQNTDPAQSLGGDMSNQLLISGLNQLFSNWSAKEQAVGADLFRCLYIKNEDANHAAKQVKIWLNDLSAEIGVDIAPAQTLSNQYQPPTNIHFVAANSDGNALEIEEIPVASAIPIWIKITAQQRTTNELNLQLCYSVLNDP